MASVGRLGASDAGQYIGLVEIELGGSALGVFQKLDSARRFTDSIHCERAPLCPAVSVRHQWPSRRSRTPWPHQRPTRLRVVKPSLLSRCAIRSNET
jgi:hypothetical protein